MRAKAFLVIDRHGIDRLTKRPPPLGPGEISVQLDIDVPHELFMRPAIKASICVDADAVRPVEIDAGQLEAISENIRRGLGVDITLAIVQPDQDGGETE
ncbi:MAG: hypothetical protein MI753_12420 [Hyphomicrobiales bacterium]|nr:hypothetical protein [Hyphomicrobiales bacterium]